MARKATEKKICSKCGKDQRNTNYYASNSPLHNHDKKVPYCKECLKGMANPEEIETVYSTLRAIDKPFLFEVWNRAGQSNNNHFGEYMRMICSLGQYRDLTWEDSVIYDKEPTADNTKANINSKSEEVSNIDEIETEHGSIKITKELKSKWGNYSNRDIIEMEKMYKDMERANDISTPQHKKQLHFYCKLVVLMDKALDEGDFGGYEKLSRQFDNLTKSSGFRPVDRKDGSEASGIRTFSQIYSEIEKDGWIEPHPIEETQDIVDRTIMYLGNYQRKLLNSGQMSTPPDDTPKVEDGDLNE